MTCAMCPNPIPAERGSTAVTCCPECSRLRKNQMTRDAQRRRKGLPTQEGPPKSVCLTCGDVFLYHTGKPPDECPTCTAWVPDELPVLPCRRCGKPKEKQGYSAFCRECRAVVADLESRYHPIALSGDMGAI